MLSSLLDVDFSESFSQTPFIAERGDFTESICTTNFFFKLTVLQWLREVVMTLQKMSYWRTINSLMQSLESTTKKYPTDYITDIAWVVNWLDSGSAFFQHCQMYLFLANYFSFIAFSHLMLVVNSSTNMILYIFLNKLFRLHFINLVKSIVACVCGPCRRTVRVLKIMSKEQFWNSSNSTGNLCW